MHHMSGKQVLSVGTPFGPKDPICTLIERVPLMQPLLSHHMLLKANAHHAVAQHIDWVI